MFVKNKNDVKGLLVQIHPRRKNARIIGWVGRLFGRAFLLIDVFTIVAAENHRRKVA